MGNTKNNSILYSWCRICRLPNLFTVPGDPIVGFLVVSNSQYSIKFIYTIVISVCLYLAGLITNDIADLNEDRKYRPDRPLANKDISITSALTASILLIVSAISLSILTSFYSLAVTILLTLLILSYNFVFKKSSILGPIHLGTCRVLNIMLGCCAVDVILENRIPILLILGVSTLFYVFGVSQAAQCETENQSKIKGRWLMLLGASILMTSSLCLVYSVYRTLTMQTILISICSTIFFVVTYKFYYCFKSPDLPPIEVQKSIGILLANLMVMQATGCAIANYPYLSIIFLSMLIPARFFAKRFYCS